MTKIFIASDHAGFKAKEALKKSLIKAGYATTDFGTYSEDSVDYPDYAKKVAQKVVKERNSLGILICGTGIGMSIAANKVRGARAALCHNEFMARMARRHNDANILCLGARALKKGQIKGITRVFLKESFEGGRHKRRISKIEC